MAPARTRLLLTALIVALYIGFATRTYYWDGVLFSLYIEKAATGEFSKAVLFHPNHLFYNAVGYLLFRLASVLGFHGRAISILQGLNIVASAVTASLVFVFARKLTGSRRIAMFSLELFAFGATWWKFSTDANSYIVSVLFATAAIYLLLKDPPRVIASGICFVIAMMFHELAVFMCVPAVCAIVLCSVWPRGKRFWMAGAYVTASACLILIAYALAYAQVDHTSAPTLASWILTQSKDWQPGHSLVSVVGSYFASYLKLFLGGRLALVRSFLSLPVYLGFALCLGALILAIWLFRRRQPETAIKPERRIWVVLLAWIGIYALFLAWWEPGAAFHKLYLWPPLVLIICVWISKSEWRTTRAAAFSALAAGVAAWNFSAFIFPHAQPAADPVLNFARTLDRQLPPGTKVYYSSLDSDDWYLEYFAPGRVWTSLPPKAGAEWLQNAISNSHVPVCFETSALDHLESAGVLRSAALSTGAVERWNLVNRQHRIRFECLAP
ncbi:MAG TPA: hypothetical protein VKX25_01935 [Bryobacteraceae bacterium]|nr:hypothetical protein [Bryobacteraceae bacterium]